MPAVVIMMILVAMEQGYVVPVDWQWGVRVDMPILLTWPGASATNADADVDAGADAYLTWPLATGQVLMLKMIYW